MASAFVFFPDFSLITTFYLQLPFLFVFVFVCAVQLLFETRYNFNLNRVFLFSFFFLRKRNPTKYGNVRQRKPHCMCLQSCPFTTSATVTTT